MIFTLSESVRARSPAGGGRLRLFETFQVTTVTRVGNGESFFIFFGCNPLKSLESEK